MKWLTWHGGIRKHPNYVQNIQLQHGGVCQSCIGTQESLHSTNFCCLQHLQSNIGRDEKSSSYALLSGSLLISSMDFADFHQQTFSLKSSLKVKYLVWMETKYFRL